MILNWLVGIFIVFWTVYGVFNSVNLYVWGAMLWLVSGSWLILTILLWKQKSEGRGDSWEGVISWVKGLIKL